MNSPKTPSLYCSTNSILEQTQNKTNLIAQSCATLGFRIPPNGFSIENPFLKTGSYLSIPTIEEAKWLIENGFDKNDLLIESKFDVHSNGAIVKEVIRNFIPTFVVDHFVQAEQICKIASVFQRRVGFEIQIQGKNGSSGVAPGPSAMELKEGIEKLPQSKWTSFLFTGLEQKELARQMKASRREQSSNWNCSALVQDREEVVLDQDSPFTCYLLPLDHSDSNEVGSCCIKTSIISRPRRDIAVIDLGANHFCNGPNLSNLLVSWRSNRSPDWNALKLKSISEYEIGMEIPSDCGNVLIGDQIEIALTQPRACLLPIQFV